MEFKEVFHVDIAPATAASFATSWSEDDRISIITEGGVHILDFVPDPSNVSLNLTLHRTWLVPKEVFPSKYTGVDINSLLWNLEQYDVYDAILDVTLTPELPTAKKLQSAVIQTCWSPAAVLPHSRCVLATVSNYGSVALHAGSGLCWQELASVSQHYVELCEACWDAPGPDRQRQYQLLRERTAQLVTTRVCWTSLFGDHLYLICGQLSGDVLFWKIRAVKSDVIATLKPELVLSITVEKSLQKIVCFKWCSLNETSGLLLAGGYNGRVSSWLVTEHDDGLTCKEDTVWPHEDRLSVLQLVALPRPEPLVLAVKGGYILLLVFDGAGAKLRVLTHAVGSREVTGVVAIDEDTALVATQSGRLSRLRLDDAHTENAFRVEEVQLDKNMSHSAVCGLAASRSRMLLAVVCRLCKVYDHLIHREPAQIFFIKQSANVDDLMSAMLNNQSQRLTEFWEYMEVIRLQSVVDGGVPGLQFATEEQNLEAYTSYQLRVAMVLLNMVLAQSDSPDTILLLRRRVERMAFLLFVRHVCERVSHLVGLATTRKSLLASLGTMRLWLAAVLSRGEVDGALTTQLVSDACDLPRLPGELQEEFCYICCAKSPVDSHLQVSCPNGHALPRCSLSMRPCTSMPYLLCATCGALACLDTEWQDGEVLLCVYCDRHFIVDEKIKATSLPPSEIFEEEKDS